MNTNNTQTDDTAALVERANRELQRLGVLMDANGEGLEVAVVRRHPGVAMLADAQVRAYVAADELADYLASLERTDPAETFETIWMHFADAQEQLDTAECVTLTVEVTVTGDRLPGHPPEARRHARFVYDEMLAAGLGRVEHDGWCFDLGPQTHDPVRVEDAYGRALDASLAGTLRRIMREKGGDR